jgi:glutathione S-transferase
MRLIGDALSPYAVRVMLAAQYKGIELAVEPAAGGPRGPEHLARNPIGKVPVLIDGELLLPESDVIVHYLEDRVPTPSLLPGDAAQRARARLLARIIDNYCAPSFGPFMQQDQDAITLALHRIDTALGYIDHFRPDSEFAAGDQFSVADCALIPFFHTFELLQEPFKVFDMVRSRPRLEAWWRRSCNTELCNFACSAIDRAIAAFVANR